MFENMATVARPTESTKALQAPVVDARTAVAIAQQYFRDLFPEAAEAGGTLEEIEESETGKHWLITLGYDKPSVQSFGLKTTSRAYKRFTIDQATGRVVSAKIYSVE